MSLLLTNLVQASRRGARLRSHGCVMGDKPLMQLLHKHGITWVCPSKNDTSPLPWKVGMKPAQDGNENTPVGMEPPQEAGGWTGHPCSTSPAAWGWLAVMVYERWAWPPLRTFHKPCPSSGHMCQIKPMGRARHSLEASAQFFWQRDLKS